MLHNESRFRPLFQPSVKNLFLSCKELRIEATSPRTYYGCFYLGPFSESYGLTIANAIRRTLLADLSSVAITSVKIENVSHEYSTLVGVRETVLDILLNLKEIVLKNQSSEAFTKTQFAYLQVRGPGIVRASDLKLPPMVQSIDPDQYIATLSENGKLNLTLTIDEGKVFVFHKNPSTFSASNPNLGIASSTWLAIDSVFTPVKKVNYTIQSLGSENIHKANQIIALEIWTNGSVHPKEALSKTLNALRTLFNQIGELEILQSAFTSYSLSTNKKFRRIFNELATDLDLLKFPSFKRKLFRLKTTRDRDRLLSQNFSNPGVSSVVKSFRSQNIKIENEPQEIFELGLPYRLFSLLANANLKTVNDLKALKFEELSNVPGLTKESILKLTEILNTYGIVLKN